MARARVADIPLPDFGPLEPEPSVPPATFGARLERVCARAAAEGLDQLVVYADREHSANLSFLTGFDPRFEEALLVVGPSGDPAILVGNECYGTAGAAPLPMRRHRFQDFSLPGQPRDRSAPLAEILGDEGVGPGGHVGVVGWKTYGDRDRSDLPSYLVDELRGLVGASGRVENATELFIDAAGGERVINGVDELALLEHAACRTSSGVRRIIKGLRPGMTEREAVQLLSSDAHGGVACDLRPAQSR
jgi:Xaa-Pro aminopeptidase